MEGLELRFAHLLMQIGYLENNLRSDTVSDRGGRIRRRRNHERHDYHLRHTRRNLVRLIKVMRKLRENGGFEGENTERSL